MKLIRANFLIITIFFGVLITLSLPHIFRYLALGSKYTTLIISGPSATATSWEETYTYATEANRIKNNQPINDPYIYEYRNKPSPLISELVPSVLLGVPAKVLSTSLVFILAKIFVLPLTIFVWYLIARQLGYSKKASICAALTSFILQKLFVYIPYFPKIFSYEFDGYLEAQRIYFPLISSFITSITILFILKILDNRFPRPKGRGSLVFAQNSLHLRHKCWSFFAQNKKMKHVLLAGILLGVLFYTYFFAWTLIWSSLILFLISSKISGWHIQAKKLLAVLAVGLLIGLPYFLNLLFFYQNPSRSDFILRTISFPIIDWNIPIIFRFLTFFCLITFFGKKWLKSPDKRLLILIYLTAAFLPLVSKIIFQADNQTDHWYERFLYPLSTFLLVLFAADIKQLGLKIKNFIFLAFLLLAILKFDISIYNEIKRPSEYFTIGLPRLDLYHWMAKNLPKNSVVGSLSFKEEIYLTAYTPLYAYLPQAYKTIAPTKEITDRYLFLARQIGVGPEFIKQVFIMPDQSYSNPDSIQAKDGNGFMVLLGIANHFDKFPYPSHYKIQQDLVQSLNKSINQIGRLDYLLIGPLEREASPDFAKNTKCQLIFQNVTYKLYRFHNCSVR